MAEYEEYLKAKVEERMNIDEEESKDDMSVNQGPSATFKQDLE